MSKRQLRDTVEEIREVASRAELNTDADIRWFRERAFRAIDAAISRRKTLVVEPANYQRRTRRKERELELNGLSLRWVHEYARPGDYIKVTGSRDAGFREIISIGHDCGRLLCYQLDPRTFERKQMVEMMFKKVRAVVDVHKDGQEETITICPLQDIMKA